MKVWVVASWVSIQKLAKLGGTGFLCRLQGTLGRMQREESVRHSARPSHGIRKGYKLRKCDKFSSNASMLHCFGVVDWLVCGSRRVNWKRGAHSMFLFSAARFTRHRRSNRTPCIVGGLQHHWARRIVRSNISAPSSHCKPKLTALYVAPGDNVTV
jgi:hypothetical protein